MWPALTAHQHIQIKNTLFGLSQKAIYTPTGSQLKLIKRDYMPEMASKLERMLSTPAEKSTRWHRRCISTQHLWETCASRLAFRATVSLPQCKCCDSPTIFIVRSPSHNSTKVLRLVPWLTFLIRNKQIIKL